MIDSVNNIFQRINDIKAGSKNLTNFAKPEFVAEFENKYKEMVSKNQNNDTAKNENYHPYIKVKKNKELSDKNDKIDDAIKIASKKYNVSEDLIKAVIKIESNFDQYGVSKAGAMGLMQLMPQTSLELGVEKPFDIYENIDGGTRYLKMMLNKYDHDLEKSLAAYNAGPDRVDEANDIPNIKETMNYVKSIKRLLFK